MTESILSTESAVTATAGQLFPLPGNYSKSWNPSCSAEVGTTKKTTGKNMLESSWVNWGGSCFIDFSLTFLRSLMIIVYTFILIWVVVHFAAFLTKVWHSCQWHSPDLPKYFWRMPILDWSRLERRPGDLWSKCSVRKSEKFQKSLPGHSVFGFWSCFHRFPHVISLNSERSVTLLKKLIRSCSWPLSLACA